MKRHYNSVEITYFDEERNFYTVDAWKTDDPDEEGKVVGVVHPTGDYYIFDYDAMMCENVNRNVKEFSEYLKNAWKWKAM